MQTAKQLEKQRISVVVPLWNEEQGIAQLQASLKDLEQVLAGDWEFIFVDDGSSDRTVQRLRQAYQADPRCRIVLHGNNRGIGAAMRTGFAKATGSIVCTIDADCSYKPEGLKRLVEALNGGNADIAVASPYHPRGGVEGVPGWRLSLSRGCSLLYRLISPVGLYTYTSVFRAYRREVVTRAEFATDGFVSAAEILFSAADLGYSVIEVPMILHCRQFGQSKMKVARTMKAHLMIMGDLLCRRFGLSKQRDQKFGRASHVAIGSFAASTSEEK